MTSIEILGRINENGQLEIEQPIHLPPGEVRITIEAFDTEADEALWDEQFAKSKDVLRQMALKALEESEAGMTEPFDPDDDPDAP